MKTRQLIAVSVLLASLFAGRLSATADEKLSSLQTSLGNDTVGGYVDSSVSWEPPAPRPEHMGWWGDFMHWFGFY